MRDNLTIYLTMIRAAVLTRMEYRADFIMGIIGVFILNAGTLATSWVLLSRFHDLHGWTFWEIVFLYNLWLLGHGIRAVFFRHINLLEQFIVEGTFDQILTRPANALVQFLGREVHYLGIGDVLLSITMLTLAYQNLDLHWPVWMFGWMVVIALSSAIVEAAITLLLVSTSFLTTRSRALVNSASLFSWGVVQQYPVDMFGKLLRNIVTIFLPFAFMNYYPALLFLGKQDQVSWGILTWYAPVVALILLGLSIAMWNFGIKRYQSTGS
ncbi:ABC transporter permease [Tumebacillus permanentifrigoris]|uniref:ABC-2 type transport system permease protein n=1 Tax=Tumebacillus permanentifrigoris TaxID=378543 RepID=A0A316DC93_9BACL|nr:ABC-2 family transporter protein [Tumebacillus permanentifrigoris]PWK12815.1 ABC-2 type transport system permease protein [Tumebacillus permanentifrigoris]